MPPLDCVLFIFVSFLASSTVLQMLFKYLLKYSSPSTKSKCLKIFFSNLWRANQFLGQNPNCFSSGYVMPLFRNLPKPSVSLRVKSKVPSTGYKVVPASLDLLTPTTLPIPQAAAPLAATHAPSPWNALPPPQTDTAHSLLHFQPLLKCSDLPRPPCGTHGPTYGDTLTHPARHRFTSIPAPLSMCSALCLLVTACPPGEPHGAWHTVGLRKSLLSEQPAPQRLLPPLPRL